MFSYLVALVAALFIIFGLIHVRCLNDWVQSSIRCSMSAYRGLIRRPTIEVTLNEEVENLERPVAENAETTDYVDVSQQGVVIESKEKSSDIRLSEAGSEITNDSRHSGSDTPSYIKDRKFDLTTMRNLQFGVQDDSISKQEDRENVSEEKLPTLPTSRLYTSQIYNLILKETMKENVAKQKLLENIKNKIESIKMANDIPSSSENTTEQENDISKSSKSNFLNTNM